VRASPYGFMVKVALLLVTLPEVAVMDVPEEDARLWPVARPLLDIAATLVFEVAHVTVSVIATALPSSKVAVATNCRVAPEVIDAAVGVTSIDFRLATVLAPLMNPEAAVMLAFRAATPVSPVLLTAAGRGPCDRTRDVPCAPITISSSGDHLASCANRHRPSFRSHRNRPQSGIAEKVTAGKK
jgi:hypothetical protein